MEDEFKKALKGPLTHGRTTSPKAMVAL